MNAYSPTTELPDVTAIDGTWSTVAHHLHAGTYDPVGFHILNRPGPELPYTPAACRADSTEWVLGGQILLCTGCGADVT